MLDPFLGGNPNRVVRRFLQPRRPISRLDEALAVVDQFADGDDAGLTGEVVLQSLDNLQGHVTVEQLGRDLRRFLIRGLSGRLDGRTLFLSLA